MALDRASLEHSQCQSWGKLLTRGVGNCFGIADFLATLGTEITNPTDYYYFLCVTRIAVGINPSANSLVSSQALASLWN